MIDSRRSLYFFLITALWLFTFSFKTSSSGAPKVIRTTAFFNVRDFGASGDGKSLDTAAINKTIDAAAAGGGGTVYLPSGQYLCFSIHLKSNITIFLDNGAKVIAADPKTDNGSYDLPEPNEFDAYQDF